MAEICFDCWNKQNNGKYKTKDFIISKELDICEECGEYKNVIIAFRKPFYIQIFLILFLPFKILDIVFILLESSSKYATIKTPQKRNKKYRKNFNSRLK